MSNILEVRGLRKRYGAFTLDDVAFDVPRGGVLALLSALALILLLIAVSYSLSVAFYKKREF